MRTAAALRAGAPKPWVHAYRRVQEHGCAHLGVLRMRTRTDVCHQSCIRLFVCADVHTQWTHAHHQSSQPYAYANTHLHKRMELGMVSKSEKTNQRRLCFSSNAKDTLSPTMTTFKAQPSSRKTSGIYFDTSDCVEGSVNNSSSERIC